MRQHHPVGVAPLAHRRHGVHPVLDRQERVEPEPVHADVGTVADQLLQIAEVGGVAAVADHDAGQVDALFGEDPLLLEAAPGGGVGVGRDRHAGLAVRLGDRAQHPLDTGGDARFVGGALEDCRLDAGVGDAVGDVADEHLGHDLRAVQQRPGPLQWKYSGTSL